MSLTRAFIALWLWIAPLAISAFHIERFHLHSQRRATLLLPKATIAKTEATTEPETTENQLDWCPPPTTFDHQINGNVPDFYYRQPYSFFQYGGSTSSNQAPQLGTPNGTQTSKESPTQKIPNFVEASIEWIPPPQRFPVYRLPPIFQYLPNLFEYGAYIGFAPVGNKQNSETTLGLLEQRNGGPIDRLYIIVLCFVICVS